MKHGPDHSANGHALFGAAVMRSSFLDVPWYWDRNMNMCGIRPSTHMAKHVSADRESDAHVLCLTLTALHAAVSVTGTESGLERRNSNVHDCITNLSACCIRGG